MDIKDLNKPQLILLALLLSFVTSIATGITTVTLMQQAPSSVTIPINRVVRETVEKIVPVPGKETVQTVVIKEEDLVVDAIEKNKSAIFTITKETQDLEGKTIEITAGKGFIVSDEDIVVVDSNFVSENQVLYVKNDSGKFKTTFVSSDKNGFAFLKIGEPLDSKNKLSYTLPSFGNLSNMKIGQKVIILGNSITSLIFEGSKDFKTGINKSNAGAIVLDLDGDVLGIALYADNTSFASIDLIIEALKNKDTAPVETPTPTI